MGSVLHFLLPAPFPFSFSSHSSSSHTKTLIFSPPAAARKTPKGFGPAISSQKSKNRNQKKSLEPNDDEEEEEEDDKDAGTIPEVVTNRMMQRMGLSVGIPLAIGLLFFPLFYYLKVAAKIDLPNWIPLLVSFFFFGASLLGISYGIVSASWDPLREGSVLGWNEARRNWPVFWQSFRRGGGNK